MTSFIVKNECGASRAGILRTRHGEIETPCFMPVGTLATVKTLSPSELEDIGAKIILSNTYHLYLRPGPKIIEGAGGLHRFMNWKGSILTDSGGFQVFSMNALRKITEQGVEFTSHLDGSKHFFTPEKVVEIQSVFGSDIIMVLDECVQYPVEREYAHSSLILTADWAKRSKIFYESSAEKYPDRGMLFGIIQGSVYEDLRKESAVRTLEIDFDGYALGGLSVGEPNELMYDVISNTLQHLPVNKPRYLMGVGTPEDLWECVERGIDMFDCVLPSRNARNGQAFTSAGKINLKNACFKTDYSPIDSSCDCYACRNFTRAYISHLFRCDEIFGLRLNTLHNLNFMVKLSKRIRDSILNGNFSQEKKKFFEIYGR